MSEFAYSVDSLPAGLTLNPLTGAITGTPTAAGAFSSTFTATSPTASGTLLWAPGVLDNPIVISGTAPSGVIGAPYEATLTVSGYMNGTTTMSVSSGTLPPGMSLDDAGLGTFGGVPTSFGTFDFSLVVTDSTTPTPRSSAPSSQTVVIADNPIVLAGELLSATVGDAYSATLPVSGYFVAPLTVSAQSGSIPAWMTATVSGGAVVFAGTPTSTGAFAFTPQLTDSSTPPRTGTGAAQSGSVVTAQVTWTAHTLPTESYSPYALGSAVMGGTTIIATLEHAAAVVMRSADSGATWAPASMPSQDTWASCAYGNSTFVCVTSGNGTCATSADGATWTSHALYAPNGAWGSLFFGNGLFVLPLQTDSQTPTKLFTSPDGATWTQRTVPAGNWAFGAYGNGVYVVAGLTAGSVITSSDGVTWTPHAVSWSGDTRWRNMTFGAGIFVLAVNGGVATSSDGLSWTINRFSATAASGQNFLVAFSAGVFIAAAYGSTSTTMFTSADGLNWVSAALPSAANVQGVGGGAGFVLAAASATVITGVT